MCYSDDARPPLPPIGGAAADQGDMTLTAKDGTKFMAYFARASKPTGAGMVVLPDVRGLHHFYKELAQRFAEAGIDAVAIDYFGRTAAIGFYGRPPRSEPFVSKMKAPLLMLVAGADAATPMDVFNAFDKELTVAKVPHEVHIYEDAPHSFFDRTFEQWKNPSDDAWRRILAFVKKHS